MASGLTLKELYEKYYDSKIALSTYFVPDSDFSQEVFIGRGEFLSRLFESDLKGDTLIKYGGALLPSSILPACESFKEIIIVDFLDSNLEVINQWLDKEPGTIVPCELEKHREIWTAKEEKMKKAIKQVIKGELDDCHPVAPGLAVQADCIFSEFCLEFLSTDEEGYCKALKSMSSLLKLGGCLVMFVFLDCTFYMIGNVKFPIVCLDLELVRKALTDSGFAIKELHLTPRITKKLYSMSDFSRKLFLVARKEKVKE